MNASQETGLSLLKKYSLPALVQKELEHLILSGELPSGTKLNEVMLADLLGVSRGPVREAFRALEMCGLVRQEKNVGVYVRQVSIEEADEIYELRCALDEIVGRTLALSASASEIARLREMLTRMDSLAEEEDVHGYHTLNLQFHDLMVQMSGNRKLIDTYRGLVKELYLYRHTALAHHGTLLVSAREHHEIVDMIELRNAKAAALLMRKHVLEGRARMHRANVVKTFNDVYPLI